MATSGSPVRRRRLAAELRRLRGSRTGTEVSRALRWSPAKISRYELGRGSFPLDEIEKLLDFYAVNEPLRAQLLALAEEANQRGWWDDYADALVPEYMEFIGLEAEAASIAQWQVESIPGLLQTEDYARQIHLSYQAVALTPPSIVERRVQVRMIRKEVLTARNPPLQLSAVVDESALLRKVGGRDVMRAQLLHLAQMAELPNVDVRILPLQSDSSLMADSFSIFEFGSQPDIGKLGYVVSTESLKSDLYVVEGEKDTFIYHLFFEAAFKASLSREDSRHFVRQTAERTWA
jgi:transcriptional regulator with XRE-family HTH domain